MSEDHVACITDSALVSFGEYLDLLLPAYERGACLATPFDAQL